MSLTPSERVDLLALTDACVQCALCLPHCPTYADHASETESPRGRILLARALADGTINPAEADAEDALSHCLGCRACQAACPAKVDYGGILHRSRAALRRSQGAPWLQRATEWLLARPALLRAAFVLARPLQSLPWLRRRLPPIPRARALPQGVVRTGSRGRLALVQGCVAATWEYEAHQAAIHLLTRLGWEVVALPPACCGALHRHAGATDAARELRQRLSSLIADSAAERVLHLGSGCHEAIAEAAETLPVHEAGAFIAADPGFAALRFRPSGLRVGLHVACTQRNVVGSADSDRSLLSRIPGLGLCTPAPSGCCGAAGIQSLRFPEQSAMRLAPLRAWHAKARPDLLLAGNLGCRLQLARGLGSDDATLPCRHPLSFLVEHLE